MLTIQPQYLSLSDLLGGRLFRIPDYQRAYSWTQREREDLFGDLRRTYQKGADAGHFMAAIVCLRRGKRELGTNEFKILEVVDGQQRLTTIIILLKSIALSLSETNKKDATVRAEIENLLVKRDSDELLLLQTNHDSSHYFTNYIRSGKKSLPSQAKTIADREILNAIADCEKFVTSWHEQRSLVTLVALLKNRMFFLLHEIDQEQAVYTVFEVLNSRGLQVSWLDRLKSVLMGMAFDLPAADNKQLIKDLHVAWRDIYSVIGLRQGLSTEALRFAATLHNGTSPSRPLGEEDAVSSLREAAHGNAKTLRGIASWLLTVTKACDRVLARGRLDAVTRISQARLLAVAIEMRDDLTEKDRAQLLERWEKVTFRIYGMLGNDARTRVGEYVRLAWDVVKSKLPAQSIQTRIDEIGSDFSIGDAVNALRNANCYEGWQDELRYFMFKYEEHLCRLKKMKFTNAQWDKIWLASPFDSIEHIFPQSKAGVHIRHRLGNLVLLPPRLNSQLQDNAPIDKVKDYVDTGLLVAGEVANQIQSTGKWHKPDIEKRELALLKWAKREWA